jgi:hypothetical protein
MSRSLPFFVAVMLLLVTAVSAAEKKPAIGNFPFWSAPKREFADQFVPGLNAALLLTPEQIEQLHAARRETLESDAVKALPRKDPNLSEAQREAARKIMSDAHANLRTKVSNILTAEQRSLIERINAAHQEVEKTVLDEFQPRMVAAKGNDQLQETLRREFRERVTADFTGKLDRLLSPNQKAARDQAAAAEIAAAKNPKKK